MSKQAMERWLEALQDAQAAIEDEGGEILSVNAAIAEIQEAIKTQDIPDDIAKDAARYRWLRNYRPGLILDMMDDREIPNGEWANELDEQIDIALSAAPSCKGNDQ